MSFFKTKARDFLKENKYIVALLKNPTTIGTDQSLYLGYIPNAKAVVPYLEELLKEIRDGQIELCLWESVEEKKKSGRNEYKYHVTGPGKEKI